MKRLAVLLALFVACATPTESQHHIFGYTSVPAKAATGGNPWSAAATSFVQGLAPSLTQCEYMKVGQDGYVAIPGTTTVGVSQESGGFGVSNATVWSKYTQPIYMAPRGGQWGIAWRGRYPLPLAANSAHMGIVNAASSHVVTLAADASVSATKWTLEIIGAATTTSLTTMNADGDLHDFSLIFDGTTLTAYVDGAAQATQTNLTNLADEGMAIGAFSTAGITPGSVIQQIEYCTAPILPFSPAGTAQVTFTDGTVRPGTLMFDDEFTGSSLGTAWVAEANWGGPLAQVPPEVCCTVAANATVSGGNLNLAMTANARGSCPQSWTATTFYNTLACGGAGCATSYTPGATTVDTAQVSMKNFQFTYGRVDVRMKMAGGTGPGSDVTLWGANCQSPLGFTDAFFHGPFFTGGAGACNWPAAGSQEMDILNYAGGTGALNTTNYVSQTPGTPPAIPSAYFGTTFYGERWQTPNTAGFTNFIGGATVTTPASVFHVYSVIWTPTSWSSIVDGVVITNANPGPTTWIPNTPMFMMIWNQDATTVNGPSLPQTAQVDYVRITCPPGVPCVVNHAP